MTDSLCFIFLSFFDVCEVFVRLRPTPEDEENDKKKSSKDEKGGWDVKKMGSHDCIVERGVLRKADGRTSFNVDQIFDEYASTPFLYKHIARAMVHTVLGGKHATIFAYGETGSGYVLSFPRVDVVHTAL